MISRPATDVVEFVAELAWVLAGAMAAESASVDSLPPLLLLLPLIVVGRKRSSLLSVSLMTAIFVMTKTIFISKNKIKITNKKSPISNLGHNVNYTTSYCRFF